MTGTRVLTALVLVPAVVSIVWFAPTWAVALCVAAVVLLALREFFALSERAGFRGYFGWTSLCSILALLYQWMPPERGPYFMGFPGFFPMEAETVFLTFILGVAVLVVAGRKPTSEALSSTAISAAALIFVAWPLSFLVRLHGIAEHGEFLLLVLSVVWAGDSAAYFVGRGVGRTKLAPQISPNKTMEGAIANLLGSVAAALAFSWWLDEVGLWRLAGAGIVASIAGQLGDLLESSWKRTVGVKDSGGLLPGHGGILDRVDALIFAAPAVWCYFASGAWNFWWDP